MTHGAAMKQCQACKTMVYEPLAQYIVTKKTRTTDHKWEICRYCFWIIEKILNRFEDEKSISD